MGPYQHILLATDLSDSAAPVYEKGVKLAQLCGAKVSLVHAIEPIPAYGYPGLTDMESPIIESAKKEMVKVGEQLKVDPADQHVIFGSVKGQVLALADELKVDLIIIGSHGRHGFSRLLGSSASGIVHGAKCDVTTIRCADA